MIVSCLVGSQRYHPKTASCSLPTRSRPVAACEVGSPDLLDDSASATIGVQDTRGLACVSFSRVLFFKTDTFPTRIFILKERKNDSLFLHVFD